MEIPFDPALYQQTRPADPGEEDLTPRLPSLAHDLAEATKALIRRPYDPTGWFARAKLLDELRFPELATGDAYKASLLCRKHLQVETIFDGGEGGSADGESRRWRLGEAMGFWMLDEDVGSHQGDDEASVCELNDAKGDDLEHRLRELSDEVGLFLSEHIRDFPESGEGSYRPRMYPWMPERFRTRTQALLDQVNEEFVQQGDGGKEGGLRGEVRGFWRRCGGMGSVRWQRPGGHADDCCRRHDGVWVYWAGGEGGEVYAEWRVGVWGSDSSEFGGRGCRAGKPIPFPQQ